MTLFKRLIAMSWKAVAPPRPDIWLKALLKWMTAEIDIIHKTQQTGGQGTTITLWDTYVLKINVIIDEESEDAEQGHMRR